MGGKGQSGKEEEKQSIELKLYGDMFNSECRTIMCLFDLTNTTIKLRQVDTIDKIQGKSTEELSSIYMSFKE
jgi:hypothetical protein|tara:strand:+ start:76 stop:291 length:216 start_codon:yes stop_codon:yes gene_type:complete